MSSAADHTSAEGPDRPSPELAGLIEASGVDAEGRTGDAADGVEYRVQAERTVGLLAEALARLHATPVPPESGSERLDPGLIAARARRSFERAELDDRTVSAAYAHLDDARLVQALADGAAAASERGGTVVLTHGAPTLARLRAHQGQLVGLVDWRYAALADPYRDLAVAARSVAQELTPALVPLLFERYSPQAADPLRLDWYALAAELRPPESPW